MNSLGWTITACIGLLTYAISGSFGWALGLSSGFALVMLILIAFIPSNRPRRRW